MSSYFALWRAILHVPFRRFALISKRKHKMTYGTFAAQRHWTHKSCPVRCDDTDARPYRVRDGMSFEIPLHRARRYIAHTLRQTQRQIKRVTRGKIKSVSQSRHFLQANKTFFFVRSTLSLRGIDKSGVPAGYFVPVGKRRKQEKEWALSFPITWFQKRGLRRIARKGTIS